MRVLRNIAVVSILASRFAYGQAEETQPLAPPASSGSNAVQSTLSGPDALPIGQPPKLPTLAPFSQDLQAAMANSQLQTYRYTQLTEQALALKKLCETGFGPSDICPKTIGSESLSIESRQSTGPAAPPTVVEINGTQNAFSAVLVYSDGRRVTVRRGSILADGLKVTAVTADDVRVTKDGRPLTLSFGSASPQ